MWCVVCWTMRAKAAWAGAIRSSTRRAAARATPSFCLSECQVKRRPLCRLRRSHYTADAPSGVHPFNRDAPLSCCGVDADALSMSVWCSERSVRNGGEPACVRARGAITKPRHSVPDRFPQAASQASSWTGAAVANNVAACHHEPSHRASIRGPARWRRRRQSPPRLWAATATIPGCQRARGLRLPRPSADRDGPHTCVAVWVLVHPHVQATLDAICINHFGAAIDRSGQ